MRLKEKYQVLITDYNTKINKIEKKINDHSHDKYIATPEFNKLKQKFCCKISASKFSNKGRF